MKHYLAALAILFSSSVGAQKITLVGDIYPGGSSSQPGRFTITDSNMYFFAHVGAGTGQSPYSLDIDEQLVKLPAKANMYVSQSNATWRDQSLQKLQGRLYMPCEVNGLGQELVAWNTADSFGKKVYEALAGADDGAVSELTTHNGRIYFRGRKDGSEFELHMYDPVTDAVHLAVDMNGSDNGNPTHLVAFNNKIYFFGDNGSTYGFHSYDPATGTTSVVFPFTDAVVESAFLEADGKLFFVGKGNQGKELYSLSSTGTLTRHSDVWPGADDGIYTEAHYERCLALYKNSIYFVGHDNSVSQALWRYDITGNTVYKVSSLNSAPTHTAPYTSEIFVFHDKLYFMADDGQHGQELWVYDGIHAPVMIKDMNTGAANFDARFFTEYNNRVYFNAMESNSKGAELYRLSDTSVSIKKSFRDTLLCKGTQINLPYTVTDTFEAGNVFTAQLSDANGSFGNAINIGNVNSTIGGSIACTIPATLPDGNKYKIRIVSSKPATLSFEELPFITIETVVPSVTLNALPGTTLPKGGTVSFTTTIINAGAQPTFRWIKDGAPIANAHSGSYTAKFDTAATICVIMTSNAACAEPIEDTSCLGISILPAHISKTPGSISADIYPNPNKGNFTIVLGNATTDVAVIVTDIRGKKVFDTTIGQEHAKSATQFNLTNIPAGIYMLQAAYNGGIVTKSFIVE